MPPGYVAVMDFRRCDANETDTATIRLSLLLAEEPDRSWCHLFDSAMPPLEEDELEAAYEAHGIYRGVSEASIYIELKPGVSDNLVFRALDWLSTTAGNVDQMRLLLKEDARRARSAASSWSNAYLTE